MGDAEDLLSSGFTSFCSTPTRRHLIWVGIEKHFERKPNVISVVIFSFVGPQTAGSTAGFIPEVHLLAYRPISPVG